MNKLTTLILICFAATAGAIVMAQEETGPGLTAPGEFSPTEETVQADGGEEEEKSTADQPEQQPQETEEPSEGALELEEVVVEAPATNGDARTQAEEITIGIESEDEDIQGAEAETGEENRISITLDDVEMADVVRLFTRISGANIIATPSNLQGRVTVNLEKVDWQPALESILSMHNLALREKTPGSGIYSITPQPKGQPEPLEVETVFLNYATVDDVVAVVQPMLSGRGSVSPFASRNALVIQSTAPNIGEIKQVVDRIDKLREQVFIEAKFMELTDEAIKDLGINWQVLQEYGASAGSLQWSREETRSWTEGRADTIERFRNRQRTDIIDERYDMDGEQVEGDEPSGEPTRSIIDSVDNGRNVSRNIEDSFSKVVSDVRTAVLSADDFRLILSALKQMNGVSVVSNPKIIVANEETALIHIGEIERPFESTVTPATDTSGPVVTYNPGEPVEFGVKLNVTPTVNTESNITVKIEPELTRFVRDAVAPNGQTYPIIATKKISTVFCLESGRTVAIGGLTETEDNDQEKKIPLLGDIPLIGKYLFSHTHKQKSQKETMIFVTLGYAKPAAIEREMGLPSQTKLTQQKMIESDMEAYQSRKDLEEMRNNAARQLDRKAEQVKEQLESKAK